MKHKFILVYGVWRHFQQYFSYIMAASFIGGGNQRKPLTCRKSLTNIITMLYCVHLIMNGVRTYNFRMRSCDETEVCIVVITENL
jgi:hypothetical protein